jgi:hypothetical protein
MLAGAACTLISIKSQNAKANKELNAKLMTEISGYSNRKITARNN